MKIRTIGTLAFAVFASFHLSGCDAAKTGEEASATGYTMSSDAAKNATESARFMADNKSKPGVKTTASGLQYRIVRAGPAENPTATTADQVVVDYEGKFVDGKIFDSSYEAGTPATFGVTQVIPGWTEALQLMRPGDEFTVYLPADIAYGATPPAPDFPANAALIFKVELRAILRPDGSAILQPKALQPAPPTAPPPGLPPEAMEQLEQMAPPPPPQQ
jgi:FKBP-type peptidyl-prolyl cis-trans isomerase